jgi:hypothetical protein
MVDGNFQDASENKMVKGDHRELGLLGGNGWMSEIGQSINYHS